MSGQLHPRFYQIVHRDIRTGAVVDREPAVPPEDVAELYQVVTAAALRRRADGDDGGWGDDIRPTIDIVHPHSANAILSEALKKMRLGL